MKKYEDPARLSTYFRHETPLLAVVSVTGILYNVGMTMGPWFEGQLAQYFADILGGSRTAAELIRLSLIYVLVILFVQFNRFLKRLYVRKFANNISYRMKNNLYSCLVHKSRTEMEHENTGALMTKAISDVEACTEGMRKFTTEIFDTGVVMIAYLVMLLMLDWRLTLICCIFPPIAYIIADKMKKAVTGAAAAQKQSSGALNSAVLVRVQNALTLRVFGQEQNQRRQMEERLGDYERRSAISNILAGTPEPLYNVIAMIGAFFILWLGGRNVLGQGWKAWNIAAFSTFLSCFTKLAVKSSHAAKLFNAVQKAQVSWARIRPYLGTAADIETHKSADPGELSVSDVSFSYPAHPDQPVIRDLTFDARPGDCIGITGEIASGKSTLGKIFLCETPYRGHILWNGSELSDLIRDGSVRIVSYLGHDPELFSASVRENILLGDRDDLAPYLRDICMDREISEFESGADTQIGNGGMRLSGGQKARIGLARTIAHRTPLMILDDPFAALDTETEKAIYRNLKWRMQDGILMIISHRLELFPSFQKVLWVDTDGSVTVSDHQKLMEHNPEYRRLFELQENKKKAESGEGRS